MSGKQEISALSPVVETAPSIEPAVVAIGPWNEGEFAPLLQQLSRSFTWSSFPSLRYAVAELAQQSDAPEVALIAFPRPNYYSSDELLELQQAAPLLRIVIVAGTWCEGELRTGAPPDGLLRLYWYEVGPWWEAALDASRRGAAPPWSSPPRDQFRGPEFATLPYTHDGPNVVAVDATDYSVFEALHAALVPYGWSASWQPRDRPMSWTTGGDKTVAAGIFDAGQLDQAESAALARFSARLGEFSAPVVVLLDFPRVEHTTEITTAGAAALLPKPYRVEALATLLSQRVGVA